MIEKQKAENAAMKSELDELKTKTAKLESALLRLEVMMAGNSQKQVKGEE